MDKITFNKLQIIEQLEYVNSALKKGESLRSISAELKMSKTTIRDRFQKIGYKFEGSIRQYIKIDEEPQLQNEYQSNNESKDRTVEVLDSITKVYKGNNYNDDTNVILKDITEKLNEVYSWYLKERNIIEPVELKLNNFEGEAINRTFKVYPKELQEFKKFCEEHKQYRVQDIITQALREFMDKYK